MKQKEILDKVEKLMAMHKNGELGGEVMPEDANPHLEKDSKENYPDGTEIDVEYYGKKL